MICLDLKTPYPAKSLQNYIKLDIWLCSFKFDGRQGNT